MTTLELEHNEITNNDYTTLKFTRPSFILTTANSFRFVIIECVY